MQTENAVPLHPTLLANKYSSLWPTSTQEPPSNQSSNLNGQDHLRLRNFSPKLTTSVWTSLMTGKSTTFSTLLSSSHTTPMTTRNSLVEVTRDLHQFQKQTPRKKFMKLKQSSTTKRYGTPPTIWSNGLDGLHQTTLGSRRTTSPLMISLLNTGPKPWLLIPLFAVLQERKFALLLENSLQIAPSQ